VNRANPASGVLALEIYRFKAAPAATAGTPPIFRLYGGPNFLGLAESLATPGFYEQDILPYTQIADLVVVSQRASAPPSPRRSAIVRRSCRWTRRSTAVRRRRLPADGGGVQGLLGRPEAGPAGFTVIEAAADVDDVRRAMGYDKIILWGGSFGSHWGMAIMRSYPQIVARAILRGMEGPDHTYDMPTAFWERCPGSRPPPTRRPA